MNTNLAEQTTKEGNTIETIAQVTTLLALVRVRLVLFATLH